MIYDNPIYPIEEQGLVIHYANCQCTKSNFGIVILSSEKNIDM